MCSLLAHFVIDLAGV